MNTDIRIKVSFKNHRKRKRLRRLIGDRSDSYLIDFWLTVATDAPTGILIGWDDQDIADACNWDGPVKTIVDSLIECNWLEKDSNGEYVVHDWCIHQAWACNADQRSVIARKAATIRWENKHKKDAKVMLGACGENTGSNAPSLTLPILPSPKVKKKKEQIPPSVEDVKKYCLDRKNNIDPEYFINHYKANGWMRGKNKIKSWKACVITWEKNNNNNNIESPKPNNPDTFKAPESAREDY